MVRSVSPVGKGFQNSVRGQEKTDECVGNTQKGNEAETEKKSPQEYKRSVT